MNSKPVSVQRIMHSRGKTHGNNFTVLLDHARVLNHLDEKLVAMVDPALSRHCQVAELRRGKLILACANAAVATRLRIISQPLLLAFKEEGEPGIESIEVRIAPINRPQVKTRKRRPISTAAIQALGRFAADSGDTEIQAWFDQISTRENR